MAKRTPKAVDAFYKKRSIKRSGKYIPSPTGHYGAGYKTTSKVIKKLTPGEIKPHYDDIISGYKKIKNPTEKDKLRLLGALDAIDEFGGSTNREQLSNLRSQLYPIIKTDVVGSPLDYSATDIGLAIGGLASSIPLGHLSEYTKNENVANLLADISKREKIPVSKIFTHKPGGFFGKIFANPVFKPGTKEIHTLPSEAIGLHELGHAKDFKTNAGLKRVIGASLSNIPLLGTYLKKALPLALVSTPIVPSAAIAPLLSNNIREKIKGKDKGSLRSKIVSKVVEENPWSLGLAAFSPILYREGKASAFALKQLKKLHGWKGVGKGLITMLPDFAAYAAGAGLASNFTNRLVRHQENMERARKIGNEAVKAQ